ncbi:hypothetical protein TNCV_1393501 [Trichonephila clavipes]|nr:hypothetical protein TNCV_1393501 [Trichonephila clavipes]
MMKDAENLTAEIEDLKSELTLLGTCPVLNCQFYVNLNNQKISKRSDDCTKQRETKPANPHLAATDNDGNPTLNQTKKNNRPDGFASPTRVAKKQKLLQNYSFGAAAPVNTKNKFQLLTGRDASPTKDDTATPVALPPKKIPLIHLKFQSNYNLIMQEINRKYPKSNSKLSGEFLRIFASSPDEHREITDFLKKKGECPTAEKIENPVCINCKETGHLANSHRCAFFPKIQPKKGDPSQNRSKSSKQNSFNPNAAKVKNEISLQGKQHMTPQIEMSESANTAEATPAPPGKENRNKQITTANLLVLWTQSMN